MLYVAVSERLYTSQLQHATTVELAFRKFY